MINMLSYYRDGWQVLVFPRGKHRPWQYFEEGEKNILLSPAAVDMGGTLITPLEKDFHEDHQRGYPGYFFPGLIFRWDISGAESRYLNSKLKPMIQ